MPSPLVSALLYLALPTWAGKGAMPRMTLALEDTRVSSFSPEGVYNYSKLLLALDGDTLFVAARDALFSLNVTEKGQMSLIKELRWGASEQKVNECSFKGKSKETDCFNFVRILVPVNGTQLYACGTYAYSPTCAYIDVTSFSLQRGPSSEPLTEDGKGRCPFDPAFSYTAVMADGELYTATMNNFQGSESTIARSLGVRAPLKTETSLKWLQDPVFVGSVFVPQEIPEQDKVYFFFMETAPRLDPVDRTTLTRIARVCKDDEGGARVLQKRWTTFLKARMLCFLPGDGFPFDLLQDIVLSQPPPPHTGGRVLYGVFNSQWRQGGAVMSAVCAFSLRDAERVFEGRYRELNRETQSWSTYTRTVTEPRPGSCYSSTGWAADTTLNFLKDHFLMDGALTPIGERPLLLGREHRYLKLVVDTIQALTGSSYTVLFLYAEAGLLHKAVVVHGEAYIVEEIQLFPTPQPIHSLLLAPNKAVVYVSSPVGVMEVFVCHCGVHTSCGACVLSRDPHCAWDPEQQACKHTAHTPTQHRWVQDIERADASTLCSTSAQPRAHAFAPHPPPNTPTETRVVELTSLVRLPCPAGSRLARRSWRHEGAPVETAGPRYLTGPGGLVFAAEPATAGLWECWAAESHGLSLAASYRLRLVEPRGWRQGEAVPSQGGRGGEARPPPAAGKTYWGELVTVSVLFALSGAGVLAWVAHRARPGRAVGIRRGSPAGKGEPAAEAPDAREERGEGAKASGDIGPFIPGQASGRPLGPTVA